MLALTIQLGVLVMLGQQVDQSKFRLWRDFVEAHNIEQQAVPLFDVKGGRVRVIPYGQNNRLVLKRSEEMEALMR
ncbi:MAG: hypothetical protein KatS3mg111_2653 [Pirellulaceae bacterium]|nr:MAG: hypothetical protein KatS3mg111_2653 [Pirellulaceae bacterium]